jgi:Ala-tRNA(Pro) deacylase
MAAMTGSKRFAAYLREHGVPFSIEDHRLVFTAQEVAAEEHVSGKIVAKAVLVLADATPHIILLPAHYHAHLGYLRRVLGASEVRLANDTEIAYFFPDCEPGAVPPFGNLYGIAVHVHRALADRPEIVVQPGSHTETFRLRYADFARLVRPALVEAQ